MAFSNIGTNSSASATATEISWNLSQTVTVGNALIVYLVFGGVQPIVTVTASGNAMAFVQAGLPTAANVIQLFKLEDCPSSVTQVTASGITSSSIVGIAAEFNPSTASNDNVTDTGGTSSFSTSPWTSVLITTNGNDLFITGLRSTNSAVTWGGTSPDILALNASGSIASGLVWRDSASSGSYSSSGTAVISTGTYRVIIGALQQLTISGYSSTAQQAALVSFGD